MWKKIFFGQEIIGGITKWGLFWRGIIVMLFGAVFAFKPLCMAINLGFLTGFLMTFSGIWLVISAFSRANRRAAWCLYGILLTLGGALLLVCPEVELIFLAWCLGTFFLSAGIIGLTVCRAVAESSVNKTLNIISSVISILAGLFLFISPIIALAQLVLVTGIILLAEGALLVISSFFLPDGKQL